VTEKARRKRRMPEAVGEVRADSVYTLAEVRKRLQWGHRTAVEAQRQGLETVKFGRLKYVSGAAILRFFATLAGEESGVVEQRDEGGPS